MTCKKQYFTGEIAQYLACAHNLAYDEKPNYQMLKKILNPGGTPLGPLEFSTKGETVNVHTPHNQKVSNGGPGIP